MEEPVGCMGRVYVVCVCVCNLAEWTDINWLTLFSFYNPTATQASFFTLNLYLAKQDMKTTFLPPHTDLKQKLSKTL